MHFLRSSRHASSIITAVVLVVVGVVVGLTRHDPGDKGGVQLRADEQGLQPSPTVTVPGDIVGRAPGVDGHGGGEPPPMTLGKLGDPIKAPAGNGSTGGGGGNGSSGATSTTQHSSGGTTTTVKSNVDPFAAGRIAFSANGSVWTIEPDGTAAARIAAAGFTPAWSPDHKAIAYADADSPGGVLRIATSGDNYPVTTGVAKDSQPSWSPDGKQLAFARVDTTQPVEYSEIWVVNRDGSNARQLTHLTCFNRDPSWSPDGKKVVFWSSSDHCTPSSGQGGYELYTVDPTTPASAPTRLNTKPNSGAPAWSPDGKSIAFSCDGYGGVGFEVCVMWNTDSTTAHRITNLNGDQADPAWSPEGKYLAFVNGGSLWIMRSDGSNAKQLVANAIQPSW